MRNGEMDIFNCVLRTPVPVLPCYVYFLLHRYRLRTDKFPITSIQRHALHLVRIRFVQKTELLGKFTAGNVKFLNDIVVRRIENLTHIQKVRIYTVHHTLYVRFCIRNRHSINGELETVIEQKSHNNDRHNSDRHKHRHDDRLDVECYIFF